MSRPEVRARATAAYEAPSLEMPTGLRQDFVDDPDACTAQLRFPIAHRKMIRTTNLLERLFEEERRRTPRSALTRPRPER